MTPLTPLYIVYSVDPCGYNSYPVSYNLTRKGALKFIMKCKYRNWQELRYIKPDSYDDDHYYIIEGKLSE